MNTLKSKLDNLTTNAELTLEHTLSHASILTLEHTLSHASIFQIELYVKKFILVVDLQSVINMH